MSDNFTDTNSYASTLNLNHSSNNVTTTSSSNPSDGTKGIQSTSKAPVHNYVPLQPNPRQTSAAPIPLRSFAPHISNNSPPPLLPLTKKRSSNTTTETNKQRKKVNSKADSTDGGKNSNNLNTLANIAVSSPTTTPQGLHPSQAVPRQSSNQRAANSTPSPLGGSLQSDLQSQSPPQQVKTQTATQQPQTASQQQAGHRPVTSCTHCRQHKIKCNASERFPAPCQRCEKMGLTCEIDPQFRPRKGSQIQSLRNDVDELKLKIEYLQRNESLIAQALSNQQAAHGLTKTDHTPQVRSPLNSSNTWANSQFNQFDSATAANSPPTSVKTILKREPHLLMDRRSSYPSSRQSSSPNSIPQLLNDSAPTNSDQRDLPPFLEMSVRANTPVNDDAGTNSPHSQRSVGSNSNSNISEFVLGDVSISSSKANELHDRFIKDYLPYFPIMSSNSASELYTQSQLLFWTVCLTACLSDPDPTLYNQLASLIKQLAIETCWIRTPRSTHISQALLILCIWPLPNQKVLDDCSYRFVGLAKSLGYQLGLHRGKFMSEFSRTQVSLPDAEKWRTRSWLGIFFSEQFWASQLGLPPSLQTDYLVENARIDKNLPKNFRSLISLSIFQAKLVNVMGSSVISPDGLMEARNRAGSLAILERELERLVFKLEIDDLMVEIYYLYVKLTICCFAFLPETPTEDQTKYVTVAYLAATRVVTLVSKLLETKNLIELPIFIRQSTTYAAFILFKLHLTPLLLDKYIDSARQSIVTVHRLFRNQLAAWKDVENDISRTAQVLEKLNFVLFTHPELYTKNDGIITRMRSHLTGSLFYDLVWCIHEARRRTLEEKNSNKPTNSSTKNGTLEDGRKKPIPLPFYNQINKDDFQTITTTTPGGTTITKLVPTENAMTTATANATAAGLSKPTEIKGIPLSMLDSTGSIPASAFSLNATSNQPKASTSDVTNLRRIANKNAAVPTGVRQQQSQPQPLIRSNSQTSFQQQQPQSENADSNHAKISPQPVPYSPYDLGNLNVPSPSNPALGFDIGDRTDFDSFFQQQSAGWMEGNDDVLGWFDMNMAPEF